MHLIALYWQQKATIPDDGDNDDNNYNNIHDKLRHYPISIIATFFASIFISLFIRDFFTSISLLYRELFKRKWKSRITYMYFEKAKDEFCATETCIKSYRAISWAQMNEIHTSNNGFRQRNTLCVQYFGSCIQLYTISMWFQIVLG